jgi:hypothetical protein
VVATKKTDDSTAVRTDIVVNNPPIIVVALTFVVGLICLRIENLLWILRPVGPLWPRFCVGQTKFAEEGPEIIWAVRDAKLLLEKMLNLL